MAHRFFVTVIAPNRRTFLRLQEYDFDLFQPTSKSNERKEFTIEGFSIWDKSGGSS